MQIFGHRGAAGYVAENTLPSFRKAIALGVDGIEFDVRVTRDLQPVIIHDPTTDRTCGVPGRVAELSLGQLRELIPAESEQVPTLVQTLAAIGSEVRINIELKEIAACEPTLFALQDCVSAGVTRGEKILVTSFEHQAIERVRGLTDEFAVGLLTKGYPDESYWALANTLQATAANIDLDSVNRQFVMRAHDTGLEVMVYTVNSLEVADRMRRLDVDAIFTDYPDQVGWR